MVIYVNCRLKSLLCTDIYSAGFEECLWCIILTDYVSLLVGLCYRCPSSDGTNNDKLLELFEAAADYNGCTNVMILGDFNYPAINFKTNTVSLGSMSDASKFYEKCQDLCLFQHVHQETRFHDGQCPSCLDYRPIFTDEDNLIQHLQYLPPLGKSDHILLSWDITVHTQDLVSHLTKYNYWRGDYDAISENLSAVNWPELFHGKSVMDMWQHFKAIITELIVSHIPLKGDKFRKKKGHWLRPTTIRMIKKRDSARKKYIRFKSNTNYNSYKTIRNKVNSMIRADGDAFRKSLFKGFKTKPKKFYSYIRSLQTVKDAATVLQKPDNTLTTTDDETAGTLKNQYQKIFVIEPSFDPSNTTVGITDGPNIENVSY